jgi:hypothetical protein
VAEDVFRGKTGEIAFTKFCANAKISMIEDENIYKLQIKTKFIKMPI